MIDLYAAGTSNGVRARIALEECGLSYKLHPIDLAKGEQKSPQYLALNPMGQIPCMVDSEGPGGKAGHDLAIHRDPDVRGGEVRQVPAEGPGEAPGDAAGADERLYRRHPNFGALTAVSRAKEPHAPTVQSFKDRQKALFQVWDDYFATRKYAAGDELTVADLSLYAGYWRTKGAFAECVEGFKHLERWAAEIGARPGVQRALKF